MNPTIRSADAADHDAVWAILEPTIRAGETYTLPRDGTRADMLAYWFTPGNRVFVAASEGAVRGTYLLRANQPGGGGHVANAGFMTHPDAGGRGIAQAMGRHALETARQAGFSAMQFNFVVSTNTRAVALWEHLGFKVVGRLPGAFRHPLHGFVDALVMYRTL
ncbi:GNAT family N-acetyltransferase [Methylobacterium sp. J-090]|uniref:GNAT family N-acetyltransferase n=1 Tax=Methylobacterium sp. J-090 TaxID=2836666 RepID=UPI001FB9F01C|nr:N-acetyltransferase [Methylobacterium sp. J-090]MCJ2083680.1 GNAT family N-acetyltransferase [Methylobacterium sp. J-090]